VRLYANRFRGNIGWTWWPRCPMGPRKDLSDWDHCGPYHATLTPSPRERAVIDELERVRHLARFIYRGEPRHAFLYQHLHR
jgi:hypothetical protein